MRRRWATPSGDNSMIYQPDEKWGWKVSTRKVAAQVPASDAQPMPKRAIAVMLSGIAILVTVLLVQPPKDYVGIPLLIGSLLFLLGLKVTIDELPDRRIQTWLGLSIVIVLGLSVPMAVAVAWLSSHLG
jgi:hypothetical protein